VALVRGGRLRYVSSSLGAAFFLIAGCLVPAATSSSANAGTTLSITAPTLIFDQGGAKISLLSDATALTWFVTDPSGHRVLSGTASMIDGGAVLDLSSLGPNYYNLALSGKGGSLNKQVSFAVLSPISPGAITASALFGVNMHFSNPLHRQLASTVAHIGFSHVRYDENWDTVERTSGQFTFQPNYDKVVSQLRNFGVTPLPIAIYRNPLYDDGRTPSTPSGVTAFSSFASAILAHHAIATNEVEVYNEPNGRQFNDGACGLSPDCYYALLSATYNRIKADHPQSIVVGASTSGLPIDWLGRLFDIGGLARMDVVSVHPYMYPGPPKNLPQALRQLRDLVRAHDGGQDKQIWITEMGWPTNFESGTTEDQQADYLVQAEVLALANGVSRFYWYDLLNDGTNPYNEQDNFGLLRRPPAEVTSSVPKPAGISQAVLIREVSKLSFSGVDFLPDPVQSVRFTDGTISRRVMWSADSYQDVRLTASGPVTLTDKYGVVHRLPVLRGTAIITLTGDPVYVTGPVTAVVAVTPH
jgi:hypothetical protein